MASGSRPVVPPAGARDASDEHAVPVPVAIRVVSGGGRGEVAFVRSPGRSELAGGALLQATPPAVATRTVKRREVRMSRSHRKRDATACALQARDLGPAGLPATVLHR